MRHRLSLALVTALTFTAACGGSVDDALDGAGTEQPAADPAPTDQAIADDAATAAGASEEPIAEADMFPDVLGATAQRTDGTWTISATLSSPYDTPERYADAWRVVGPDGEVYAERILTHDHANEQPFTRSQSGVEIPADVSVVVIEGRDLEFGYGGDTFELVLPR